MTEAHTAQTLLVPLAFSLYGLGIVVALIRGNKSNNHALSTCLFLGSFVLFISSVIYWPIGFKGAPLPIYAGAAVQLTQQADCLSLFFLGILSFVAMAVALYSPSYLQHMKDHYQPAIHWIALFCFVASMAQVFLCGDAISFIVFWEIMSLSSVVLVLTDHVSKKARQAALIYLGATRVSTTLIFAGFLWLHSLANSWSFGDFNNLADNAVIPLTIVFIGLSIKAGTWPFHLWLPYAHTEAPAPVSALMSGVMVKVAIYAMIRLVLMSHVNTVSIAYVALILGAVSAFWGILFAQVENDLKRLLAYSTVENVGLIILAIGLVLLGKSNSLPAVAAIALAACLFHILNHGMYKPLLFLSAGAVDWAVHTRNLSRLGGLQRYMPWTAAAFFLGSVAICALPPLNGFASKWLLYQGLFALSTSNTNPIYCPIGIAFIGLLSMIGALSVASFTKGFGLCFLGRPHTTAIERVKEMPIGSRIALSMLMVACVVLSVFAISIPRWLAPVTSGILPVFELNVSYPESQLLIALAVLIPVVYVVLINFGRSNVKSFSTWECGYGRLPKRSSIDSMSFSAALANLFRMVVQLRTVNRIAGKDRRHFPDAIEVEGHQTLVVEKWVYRPILSAFDYVGQGLIRLQTGSIHVHLLYVFATLVVLVVIGTLQ